MNHSDMMTHPKTIKMTHRRENARMTHCNNYKSSENFNDSSTSEPQQLPLEMTLINKTQSNRSVNIPFSKSKYSTNKSENSFRENQTPRKIMNEEENYGIYDGDQGESKNNTKEISYNRYLSGELPSAVYNQNQFNDHYDQQLQEQDVHTQNWPSQNGGVNSNYGWNNQNNQNNQNNYHHGQQIHNNGYNQQGKVNTKNKIQKTNSEKI